MTHAAAKRPGVLMTPRSLLQVEEWVSRPGWRAKRSAPLQSAAGVPEPGARFVLPGDRALHRGFVEKVVRLRDGWCEERLGADLNPKRVPRGRALVYHSELSLWDGLPEGEGELFDQADCPAWDLWLCSPAEDSGLPRTKVFDLAPTLIAWVPELLVPEVEQALRVVTNVSITWIEDHPISTDARYRWLVNAGR